MYSDKLVKAQLGADWVATGGVSSRKNAVYFAQNTQTGEKAVLKMTQEAEYERTVAATVPAVPYLQQLWPTQPSDLKKYVAFKAAEGITLEAFLSGFSDKIRIPESAVRSIVLHLTLALNALHQAGWAHNDLHSKNIIVDFREGQLESLTIIDYGFCMPNCWPHQRQRTPDDRVKDYELPIDYREFQKKFGEHQMALLFDVSGIYPDIFMLMSYAYLMNEMRINKTNLIWNVDTWAAYTAQIEHTLIFPKDGDARKTIDHELQVFAKTFYNAMHWKLYTAPNYPKNFRSLFPPPPPNTNITRSTNRTVLEASPTTQEIAHVLSKPYVYPQERGRQRPHMPAVYMNPPPPTNLTAAAEHLQKMGASDELLKKSDAELRARERLLRRMHTGVVHEIPLKEATKYKLLGHRPRSKSSGPSADITKTKKNPINPFNTKSPAKRSKEE